MERDVAQVSTVSGKTCPLPLPGDWKSSGHMHHPKGGLNSGDSAPVCSPSPCLAWEQVLPFWELCEPRNDWGKGDAVESEHMACYYKAC